LIQNITSLKIYPSWFFMPENGFVPSRLLPGLFFADDPVLIHSINLNPQTFHSRLDKFR
jgi:hypothetical protein